MMMTMPVDVQGYSYVLKSNPWLHACLANNLSINFHCTNLISMHVYWSNNYNDRGIPQCHDNVIIPCTSSSIIFIMSTRFSLVATIILTHASYFYCISRTATISHTSHYHQPVVREDSCEATTSTSFHVADNFPGVSG
jgi:hypothetical protein